MGEKKSQKARTTRSASGRSSSGGKLTQTNVEKEKNRIVNVGCKIIDSTIKNMDQRYKSLTTHKVAKAAEIVNPQNWPQAQGDSLDNYGEEAVKDIYQAFQPILASRHIDLSLSKLQWLDLKKFITRKRQNEKQSHRHSNSGLAQSAEETWADILSDPDLVKRFDHILPLIKIILVLPIHTANLERGFSQMTLIMNDKRSNLTTSSLNSLLTVRLSNTDYKDYDPLGAISKWSPWDLPDNKK